MLKKLLPIIMLVFVAACADTQGGSTPDKCAMSCCEKCECCKESKCGDCCKSGECKCCKDGSCKMCADNQDCESCMKEGKQCKIGKKARKNN